MGGFFICDSLYFYMFLLVFTLFKLFVLCVFFILVSIYFLFYAGSHPQEISFCLGRYLKTVNIESVPYCCLILIEGCGSPEETQDQWAVCVEGSLGQGPVLHYHIYIFPGITIGDQLTLSGGSYESHGDRESMTLPSPIGRDRITILSL